MGMCDKRLEDKNEEHKFSLSLLTFQEDLNLRKLRDLNKEIVKYELSICILCRKIETIIRPETELFSLLPTLSYILSLSRLASPIISLTLTKFVQKILSGPSGCFILHPVFLLLKEKKSH